MTSFSTRPVITTTGTSLIVHPSAEEMEANNIPWKGIFSFTKARAGANEGKEAQKENLRKYMTKKATVRSLVFLSTKHCPMVDLWSHSMM